MAKGTVAQVALQDIDRALTESLKMYDDIRIAELSKWEAEMRGENLSRLQQYDAYINQLRKQSMDYQNGIADKLNEYNASVNASYSEKMDSLFKMSDALQAQTRTEFDEEDDAMAQNYAAVIIDSNGDIDKSVLESVPDYLIPLVYKYAATMR